MDCSRCRNEDMECTHCQSAREAAIARREALEARNEQMLTTIDRMVAIRLEERCGEVTRTMRIDNKGELSVLITAFMPTPFELVESANDSCEDMALIYQAGTSDLSPALIFTDNNDDVSYSLPFGGLAWKAFQRRLDTNYKTNGGGITGDDIIDVA